MDGRCYVELNRHGININSAMMFISFLACSVTILPASVLPYVMVYGIPVCRYLTFVHPSAYVSRSAQIGQGTIVLANATIKNNVVLGTCNFVNSNVNIDHDCVIGNDNFFAAHACLGSAITVGNRNFFGLNSSVRTPSVIGDYNRIGMCANVLNSIDNDLVMIGNPAKPLIKH